jgi:signal transduction histidine kinase
LRSRVRDSLVAQERLQGLLAAIDVIIGDLDLTTMLRRVVQSACHMLQAEYGALGVIGPTGGLEHFVHRGMNAETVAAIGRLPRGKGLLGALIDDPTPIRLRRLADDPRSVGFPRHHPPMGAFLGVPVRVRGEVFGNLYLTNPPAGEFTEEDQELLTALAATAGMAIENARLFAQAHRRQEWLATSTEITRQLLTTTGRESLQLIADSVRRLAEADVTTVVLPSPDSGEVVVEVASGRGADALTGFRYPVENTLAGIAFTTGQPVLIGDAMQSGYVVHLQQAFPVGPVMVLPLAGEDGTRGALIVGRVKDAPRFDDALLDMATTFANHAALALELADARATRERALMLDDRDRIAGDLQDRVIQRLFGAGLILEAEASSTTSSRQSARLDQAVGELDEIIREIRQSVFQLRDVTAPRAVNLRGRLLGVAREMVPLLGFEPKVGLTGAIDAAMPDGAADDVIAVVREALSNAARHAHATRVSLQVTAEHGALTVTVSDDGVGVRNPTRSSGLANLAHRAERHGGRFVVSQWAAARTRATGHPGTQLRWTIPLR